MGNSYNRFLSQVNQANKFTTSEEFCEQFSFNLKLEVRSNTKLKKLLKLTWKYKGYLRIIAKINSQHSEDKVSLELSQTLKLLSLFKELRLLLTLINSEATKEYEECCICLERKVDIVLPCGHTFCSVDIEDWETRQEQCPVCRRSLELKQAFEDLSYSAHELISEVSGLKKAILDLLYYNIK